MLVLLLSACTEYGVQGKEPRPHAAEDTGTPDDDTDRASDTASLKAPGPEEACNGEDDDGDGEVDEGFDADGDGVADCFERTWPVTVALTADDGWEAWVDGVYATSGGGYTSTSWYDLELESGTHVLAVHAWDVGATIAGFIAAVAVDGRWVSLTGDGTWRVYDGVPADAWTEPDYDDAAWGAGELCTAEELPIWDGAPTDLRAAGAAWIWPRTCTSLGEGAFRLTLSLP